jgi:ATP-dependent helicase/nuclease subunit A
VSDEAARARALDPAESFIVQAPAGSGKTELLIQRYLALLATVEQPEQIVAITFTRKAAAEMRRRVQQALRAATEELAEPPPHQRTTRELARAALARAAPLEWRLLEQPQRLRIDTLDAFNGWLARQLPVLADGVAAARILDKADEIYRLAARRTVAAVGADDESLTMSLRTLLRGVGNDCEQLERLLAALLPRRDQWLRIVAAGGASNLRPTLEGALQRLIDDELAAAAALCDERLLARLASLCRHAAATAGPELADTLAPWLGLDTPPASGDVALAAWRGIATLLLTQKGEWRKRFTKTEGFGSQHAPQRAELATVLDVLRANEALRVALRTVGSLPDAHYTESQWRVLEALQHVLLRLAAELKLAFSEQRAVDFVELGLAAQRALGQVDAPSELLLALDRRIQHLLVDEFQDTSQSQRRLLELLTAGWQPDDGRSLFLVGDPMQSIYRFRDADMALFLLAKQRGIAGIRLTSLALQQNFRSAPAVVDWVNGAFTHIFPESDDLAAGRAGFHRSYAARGVAPGQLVESHALPETGDEAAAVAVILEEERRRDPAQSIAVLVQSRTHLAGLRERLRERGLPAHAVEIDSLAEQQVAQDLAALTRALLHLDDRIAWLAVLRAPWCGLTWHDLHALCHDDRESALLELARERLVHLSADGRQRLAATLSTLTAALACRGTLSLARWVEHTWRQLDGPGCLDGATEQLAAEQFFSLLGNTEHGGDLDDPAVLHALLDTIQPQADPPNEQGIEIMTMHRAKGLEFDTVVLLGLGREPRPDDAKVLQWLGRVAADGRDDLIMVPAAASEDDALVEFVRRSERSRDMAERARLLYVATTRARERLHLVWRTPANGVPPANSMLAQLWPVVASAIGEQPLEVTGQSGEVRALESLLRRLSSVLAGSAALPAGVLAGEAASRPEFAWAGEAAIHVGTVVHRYLQRFAEEGLDAWTVERVATLRAAFVAELDLLGVEPREQALAGARVVAALTGALADPRGRWVLDTHDEAHSELTLTLFVNNALEHIRLDRTFVAEGKRWIVDYKTSQHEGGEVDAFVDSEVQRYAPQLERYAQALAELDPRPVELALYFPLLGRLRSWPATVTTNLSA